MMDGYNETHTHTQINTMMNGNYGTQLKCEMNNWNIIIIINRNLLFLQVTPVIKN